jgi:hypothetical protein
VTSAVTGRQQSSLPAAIEQVQPALGDKVLDQAAVGVKFVAGYTGTVTIDSTALRTIATAQAEPGGSGPVAPVTPISVDLPPDGVRFDSGNYALSFQPRPGAVIDRYAVGRHYVHLLYWKIIQGQASALSYTWYFDVTA